MFRQLNPSNTKKKLKKYHPISLLPVCLFVAKCVLTKDKVELFSQTVNPPFRLLCNFIFKFSSWFSDANVLSKMSCYQSNKNSNTSTKILDRIYFLSFSFFSSLVQWQSNFRVERSWKVTKITGFRNCLSRTKSTGDTRPHILPKKSSIDPAQTQATWCNFNQPII